MIQVCDIWTGKRYGSVQMGERHVGQEPKILGIWSRTTQKSGFHACFILHRPYTGFSRSALFKQGREPSAQDACTLNSPSSCSNHKYWFNILAPDRTSPVLSSTLKALPTVWATKSVVLPLECSTWELTALFLIKKYTTKNKWTWRTSSITSRLQCKTEEGPL